MDPVCHPQGQGPSMLGPCLACLASWGCARTSLAKDTVCHPQSLVAYQGWTVSDPPRSPNCWPAFMYGKGMRKGRASKEKQEQIITRDNPKLDCLSIIISEHLCNV